MAFELRDYHEGLARCLAASLANDHVEMAEMIAKWSADAKGASALVGVNLDTGMPVYLVFAKEFAPGRAYTWSFHGPNPFVGFNGLSVIRAGRRVLDGWMNQNGWREIHSYFAVPVPEDQRLFVRALGYRELENVRDSKLGLAHHFVREVSNVRQC